MFDNDSKLISEAYTESISQKKVEAIPSHYMPQEDENLISVLWRAAELGETSSEWRELSQENPKFEKMLLKLRDEWESFRLELEDLHVYAQDYGVVDPDGYKEWKTKKMRSIAPTDDNKKSNYAPQENLSRSHRMRMKSLDRDYNK